MNICFVPLVAFRTGENSDFINSTYIYMHIWLICGHVLDEWVSLYTICNLHKTEFHQHNNHTIRIAIIDNFFFLIILHKTQ